MRESIRLPHSREFQSHSLFNPHRYIRLYRYIQFLEEFYGYLTTPRRMKEATQYRYEWRFRRFGEVQAHDWLEKLGDFGGDVGFPEHLERYLQSAEKRYDPHLLSWVIQEALIHYKRTHVVVWICFLLRKLFKSMSYHIFRRKRG